MLAAWPFQSAPHFSSEANQFWGYYRCELLFVSIRASLQQRGEPEIRASVILRARVSIRASLQQRGELKCLRSSRRNSFVSIRASLQQRGEHSIGGGVDINIKSFNPRLTSAARRTIFAGCGLATHNAFQSAPHFSSEANFMLSVYEPVNHLFQSAPHISSEANATRISI